MRDQLAQLFERLQATNRQQRLYIAVVVLGVLVAARYGGTWLVDYRWSVKEDIRLSAQRLANAKKLVETSADSGAKLAAIRTRYEQTVSQLVPGDTPTLAAAALTRAGSMSEEPSRMLYPTL